MKISQLPQTTTILDADILAIVQSGETRKIAKKDFIGTQVDNLQLTDNNLQLTANNVAVGTPVVLPAPPAPAPATNVYDYDIASLKAIKPHRFAIEYDQPAKMLDLTATARQGNICELLITLVISSIDLSSLSIVNDNVDKYMTAELTNIPNISSFGTSTEAHNHNVDTRLCDNLINLRLLNNNTNINVDFLKASLLQMGAIAVDDNITIEQYKCNKQSINQCERFYQLFNVKINGTFATQAEANAVAIEIQNFLDTMQILRLELLPLSTPKKGVPTL